MAPDRPFIPLNLSVLTVSDSRTPDTDVSGDLLVSLINASGHHLLHRALVPDNRYLIRARVSAWIADDDVQVILTTGGTGVTGRDGTPEAIEPLLDKRLDGFGECFRALSFEEIGTSTMQSRAIAGVANGTYLFALPGSPGACRLAFERLIAPQIDARTRPCNLAELMPRLQEG